MDMRDIIVGRASMVENAESAVKQKRKQASKVRTGCLTCKIRRVKCDESKPECHRCQRFGVGRCGGYPEAPPRVRNRRPLRISLQESRLLRPAPVQQPHIGPRFSTEAEGRYFRVFREVTTPGLKGVFSSSLWDCLIAQACDYEPSVLDTVIAIGALTSLKSNKTKNYSHRALLPEHVPSTLVSSEEPSPRDYEYCFKQYDKALKSIRKELADRKENPRSALIACLLVFCFETYIGNQKSALFHAQSGINLLNEWLSTKYSTSMAYLSSPASSHVEDALIQAFSQLDLQISVIHHVIPVKVHQLYATSCTHALRSMPTEFQNLSEARIWSELIQRWIMHFKSGSLSVGNAQESSMRMLCTQWAGPIGTPVNAAYSREPNEVPVSLLPEYRSHVTDVEHWFAAFNPLLTSLQATKHEDLIGATLVQIQVKAQAINLASAFFAQETGYDNFISEFCDIMTLTESIHPQLVRTKEGSLLYHFDSGIIPSIFLLAIKCRDRLLRRRALALLGSTPLKEGVFDSMLCVKIGEWAIGVEEDGIAEDEVIPEHRRMSIIYISIDRPNKMFELRGAQRRTADATELEWKHVVLSY